MSTLISPLPSFLPSLLSSASWMPDGRWIAPTDGCPVVPFAPPVRMLLRMHATQHCLSLRLLMDRAVAPEPFSLFSYLLLHRLTPSPLRLHDVVLLLDVPFLIPSFLPPPSLFSALWCMCDV